MFRSLALSLPLLFVVGLVGCGDDTGAADGAVPDGSTDAGAAVAVTLNFAAKVGTADAECGKTYQHLGTTHASVDLKDIRFYVSEVRLLDGDGGEAPVALTNDGKWQSDSVALLDFEDGTAGCENGTTDLNSKVVGTAPEGTYTGVRFVLGVPFEDNHEDVAGAEPPLNVGQLFWTWQGGHKFLRVDFTEPGGSAAWNVHIGSTMCESDGETAPPSTECGRSNRGEYTFETFDPETNTIVLDLKQLVATSNITKNEEDTAPGCQSFPNDGADCEGVFGQLGLDFTTGDCVESCSGQEAFRLE